MSGFIVLHRAIEKHWIYVDPAYFKAWCLMLFEATWEDKTFLFNKQTVTLKRGQFIYGRKAFAKKSGMTEDRVRGLVDKLKLDQMITQLATNRYSVITVLNYSLYQDKPQPIPSQSPTSPQPSPTSKQVNKITSIGKFKEPTLLELETAFRKRNAANPKREAESFFNFYASKGWVVGKTKMKSWPHSVARWNIETGEQQVRIFD